MVMQAKLDLAIDTDDVSSVAQAIKKLGDEWDIECKDAYELGIFDTDRATWIAQGIQHELQKWKHVEPYIPMEWVDEALEQINDTCYEADSNYYGLPDHDSYYWDVMRQILIQKFNLKVPE